MTCGVTFVALQKYMHRRSSIVQHKCDDRAVNIRGSHIMPIDKGRQRILDLLMHTQAIFLYPHIYIMCLTKSFKHLKMEIQNAIHCSNYLIIGLSDLASIVYYWYRYWLTHSLAGKCAYCDEDNYDIYTYMYVCVWETSQPLSSVIVYPW